MMGSRNVIRPTRATGEWSAVAGRWLCAGLLAAAAVGCHPQTPPERGAPPSGESTVAPLAPATSSLPLLPDEPLRDAGVAILAQEPIAVPTELTAAEALAIATAYAREVMPGATVEADNGGARCSEGADCVWPFSVGEAGFVLVVDDRGRAARVEVHGERWPPEKVQRYRATSRSVWAAIQARDEVRSLCKRLEYLATSAELANLQGCMMWIAQFPPDLCVAPPAADSSAPCLWEIYVGENMGDHTSRHWTYQLRTEPLQLVAVQSMAGSYTAIEWARVQRSRSALLRAVQRWPETLKLCSGHPGECPSIDEEPECERGCAWSVRFVVGGALRDLNIISDLDGRPLGYPNGDVAALRELLSTLVPPVSAAESVSATETVRVAP